MPNQYHVRTYIYKCLMGETIKENELPNTEALAELVVLIQQIGQHVKHHYKEKGFFRLLSFVNGTRYKNYIDNHTQLKDFRD